MLDHRPSWLRHEGRAGVRRAAKALEAMRPHPLDWRIEDLEAVARTFGITFADPAEVTCTLRILGSGKA